MTKRTYKRKPFAERFWPKVIVQDGCWGWKGATHQKGYGRMLVYECGGVTEAHRVSWIIHHGEIPHGMLVLHKCDNPPCTNPEHLYIGTTADNMRDCVERNRSARGERSGHAKLTSDRVREIRRRALEPGITRLSLAREYGVSPANISLIVLRQRWGHI